MAYTFTKENAATFKVTGGSGSGLEEKLTLKGINSLVESADTIVAGVQGLLYIADRANDYNWGHGIRTVNEDVDYDE